MENINLYQDREPPENKEKFNLQQNQNFCVVNTFQGDRKISWILGHIFGPHASIKDFDFNPHHLLTVSLCQSKSSNQGYKPWNQGKKAKHWKHCRLPQDLSLRSPEKGFG